MLFEYVDCRFLRCIINDDDDDGDDTPKFVAAALI